MIDHALTRIDQDLGRWSASGADRLEVIRLESSLWNAIRRSMASRSHVFPGPPEGERRRPRLFGIDVVVDETLRPGTWRLERR